MRTGYVVGETIAGHDIDAAAALFEMRYPVRLKQYLDERMLAQFGACHRMRKPMLARLDLAELQLRNCRVVYPPFERGTFERIDIKLAAEISQCI
jgi:hypothetical protein